MATGSKVRYNFGTTEGEKEWHSGSYETPFPKGLYYGFIDDSGSLNAIVWHGKIALQSSKTISLASDGSSFGGCVQLTDCTLNLEPYYETAGFSRELRRSPAG
jgi:hypothetical protein